MDDVRDFCVRMLGDGGAASAAEQEALAAGRGDRLETLIAAAASCRAHESPAGDRVSDPEPLGTDQDLSQTVARELRRATAGLPERQREALALRELLGLGYEDIARVIGVETTAVAPLLARARLRLRGAIRGEPETPSACPERERAMRVMALRLDGRVVPTADDDWLLDHLGQCGTCARAHAAMLEASACYRAWR